MLTSTLALLASIMQPSGQAGRLAPFVVRVTMDVAHGRRISGCNVRTEGNPDAHWLDDPCRHLAAPQFLNYGNLDDSKAGRLTVELRMEVNGAAASWNRPPGNLMARTSVSFDVGRDGALARCELDEGSGDPRPFPLCLGFPRGPRPFEAATNGETRAGRLSLSFYLAE